MSLRVSPNHQFAAAAPNRAANQRRVREYLHRLNDPADTKLRVSDIEARQMIQNSLEIIEYGRRQFNSGHVAGQIGSRATGRG